MASSQSICWKPCRGRLMLTRMGEFLSANFMIMSTTEFRDIRSRVVAVNTLFCEGKQVAKSFYNSD